jgi:hypothetical protein
MLACASHAWAKTILPDACGSDKIEFDVQTQKNAAAPAPPSEGKAQIIFIETVINTGYLFGGPDYTTRFGLDGAWAGAASNNAYFVLEVTPGVHHICSSVRGEKDKIGMSAFTAEAGKVYYVGYMISNSQSGSTFTLTSTPPGSPSTGGGHAGGTSHVDTSNGLLFLDEDEGKYRVKSSKLSTSSVHVWQ